LGVYIIIAIRIIMIIVILSKVAKHILLIKILNHLTKKILQLPVASSKNPKI